MGSLWPMLSNPEKYSFNPTSENQSSEHRLRKRRTLVIRTQDRKGVRSRIRPNLLTIEYSLTQSHDTECKSCKHSETSPSSLKSSTVSFSVPIYNPEISNVTCSLNGIQRCLSSCKSISRIVCFPPVDVIYSAVEYVWSENGRLEFAVRHRLRTQHNICGIPNHQGQRNSKPEQGQCRRYVTPCCRGSRGWMGGCLRG